MTESSAHGRNPDSNRQGQNMEGRYNDHDRGGQGRYDHQSGPYRNNGPGYRGHRYSGPTHSQHYHSNYDNQMEHGQDFQNRGRGQGKGRNRNPHGESWGRDKEESDGTWQHGQNFYGQVSYEQRQQNHWGQQQNYHRWDDDPDRHLSKTLSFLLRHGAEKQGFTLMPGGFLYIDDVLRKLRSLDGYTLKDVMRVVETNDKKRFAVQKDENGRMKIRANQGHTIEVEDLELTPVTRAEEYSEVIHGTYYKSWEIIKEKGLSRMGRNHIHFAAGEPGENGVISGMRSSCQVMIFVDLEKALKDGLKFFVSANNVILSPGDKDGIIYPTYFKWVLQRSPRAKIDFDNTICKGSEGYSATSSKSSKNKKKKKNKEDKSEHKEKKQKPSDDTVEGVGELFNEDKKDDTGVKNDDQDVVMAEDGEGTTSSKSSKKKKKKKCQKDEEGDDNKEKEGRQKSSSPKSDNDENEGEGEKVEAGVNSEDSKMDVDEQSAAVEMEETPDHWEDAKDFIIPSNDDQDVVMVEEYDIIYITDKDASASAVDNMMESNSPIAVTCYGENLGRSSGTIKKILCATDKNMTVFYVDSKHADIVVEGKLRELLTAREPLKIFHACAAASLNLFEQFNILLDGAELFDTKVASETLSKDPDLLEKKRKLDKIGFQPIAWEENIVVDFNGSNQNEEKDKSKALLAAQELMAGWLGDKIRQIKKHMYEEANSLIDVEKLKLAKDEAKKERGEKKKKQKAVENDEKQNQQQKNKKKKGK